MTKSNTQNEIGLQPRLPHNMSDPRPKWSAEAAITVAGLATQAGKTIVSREPSGAWESTPKEHFIGFPYSSYTFAMCFFHWELNEKCDKPGTDIQIRYGVKIRLQTGIRTPNFITQGVQTIQCDSYRSGGDPFLEDEK